MILSFGYARYGDYGERHVSIRSKRKQGNGVNASRILHGLLELNIKKFFHAACNTTGHDTFKHLLFKHFIIRITGWIIGAAWEGGGLTRRCHWTSLFLSRQALSQHLQASMEILLLAYDDFSSLCLVVFRTRLEFLPYKDASNPHMGPSWVFTPPMFYGIGMYRLASCGVWKFVRPGISDQLFFLAHIRKLINRTRNFMVIWTRDGVMFSWEGNHSTVLLGGSVHAGGYQCWTIDLKSLHQNEWQHWINAIAAVSRYTTVWICIPSAAKMSESLWTCQ